MENENLIEATLRTRRARSFEDASERMVRFAETSPTHRERFAFDAAYEQELACGAWLLAIVSMLKWARS